MRQAEVVLLLCGKPEVRDRRMQQIVDAREGLQEPAGVPGRVEQVVPKFVRECDTQDWAETGGPLDVRHVRRRPRRGVEQRLGRANPQMDVRLRMPVGEHRRAEHHRRGVPLIARRPSLSDDHGDAARGNGNECDAVGVPQIVRRLEDRVDIAL